ncbi:PREDICTED: cytochrome P450 6A1-like [Polistes dominula]|uniref:Cytochrome P450 6A1-like n=1 Tax=Polistes dominula TaxID=743375 RepID=A0ABM1IJM9_POLDO|nr:PREDICTED: cytochrome P450 6A1-like [Polistes dominula]
MVGIFEIFCSIVVIILFCYYYSTATFDFWKVRGVKGPKPIPLFGNVKNLILKQISSARYLIEICNLYKNEPYIGVFYKRTPILILKDPPLIKDVLTTDFSSFPQRGAPMAEKVEPLSQHLVLLEAERWRPLRNKLSASFSSGKLKNMFHLIRECSDNLEKYLNKIPENSDVNVYDITAKFTLDVVGNCIFGIKMNALTDEHSEFRKISREIFKDSLKSLVKFRLREAFPTFYNKLALLMHDTRTTSFFVNLVEQTIQHRIKNNIVKNDFINILKELKENPKKFGIEFELTETLCAAQAYVFFGAGFETSSLTISHALYELAQHHDIQDKLREEIKEEFERNDGTITFESVKTMKYLNAVYQETLRKYPTGMILYRECTAPSYMFKSTGLTVPKYQKIIIPIIALHHNPEIYPNPDVFDPERFLIEDNLINETTYLPFGRGPRNCIGARLAVIQTKIGLATFLHNHKVDLCKKTDIPYSFGQSMFLFQPKNGVYLKIGQVYEN